MEVELLKFRLAYVNIRSGKYKLSKKATFFIFFHEFFPYIIL